MSQARKKVVVRLTPKSTSQSKVYSRSQLSDESASAVVTPERTQFTEDSRDSELLGSYYSNLERAVMAINQAKQLLSYHRRVTAMGDTN